MKNVIIAAALAAAMLVSQSAFAQSVSGEVKKIDEAQGKITVIHGPIKNLDMDAMTMVFRVQKPVMLKQVKPGDKIRFDVDRVNGQLTITKMVRVR